MKKTNALVLLVSNTFPLTGLLRMMVSLIIMMMKLIIVAITKKLW